MLIQKDGGTGPLDVLATCSDSNATGCCANSHSKMKIFGEDERPII